MKTDRNCFLSVYFFPPSCSSRRVGEKTRGGYRLYTSLRSQQCSVYDFFFFFKPDRWCIQVFVWTNGVRTGSWKNRRRRRFTPRSDFPKGIPRHGGDETFVEKSFRHFQEDLTNFLCTPERYDMDERGPELLTAWEYLRESNLGLCALCFRSDSNFNSLWCVTLKRRGW